MRFRTVMLVECGKWWQRAAIGALLGFALTFSTPGCGGDDADGAGRGATDPRAIGTTTPDTPSATAPTKLELRDDPYWQTAGLREAGPLKLARVVVGFALRHAEKVTLARVSPDGQWFATGGADGTVHVWDMATGAEVWAFGSNYGAARDLAFNADNSRMIIGYAAGMAEERHLGTGVVLHRFANVGDVTAVAYLGDTGRVAVVSPAGTFVWTPQRTPLIANPNMPVTMARFTADGRRMVRFDPRTKMMEIVDGDEFTVVRQVALPILPTTFAVSAKGDRTALGWAESSHFLIVDNERGTSERVSYNLDGPVRHIGISPDARTIWTLSTAGSVQRWLFAGNQLAEFPVAVPSASTMIVGSRDLIVGTDTGALILYDTTTGKRRLPEAVAERVSATAISQDGTRIAVGAVDGSVTVWTATDGKIVFAHRPQNRAVRFLGLSREGSLLMAGDAREINVVSLTGHRDVFRFGAKGEAQTITSAEFSADGRFLIVGLLGTEAGCEIWDVASNSRLARFDAEFPELGVEQAMFSPANDLAAFVSRKPATTVVPLRWETDADVAALMPSTLKDRMEVRPTGHLAWKGMLGADEKDRLLGWMPDMQWRDEPMMHGAELFADRARRWQMNQAGWKHAVNALVAAAPRTPETAYSGLQANVVDMTTLEIVSRHDLDARPSHLLVTAEGSGTDRQIRCIDLRTQSGQIMVSDLQSGEKPAIFPMKFVDEPLMLTPDRRWLIASEVLPVEIEPGHVVPLTERTTPIQLPTPEGKRFFTGMFEVRSAPIVAGQTPDEAARNTAVKSVRIAIDAGEPDLDLYVSFDQPVRRAQHARFKSEGNTGNEEIFLAGPNLRIGRYYVMVTNPRGEPVTATVTVEFDVPVPPGLQSAPAEMSLRDSTGRHILVFDGFAAGSSVADASLARALDRPQFFAASMHGQATRDVVVVTTRGAVLLFSVDPAWQPRRSSSTTTVPAGN